MLHDRIAKAQAELTQYHLDAYLVERSEDLAYFLHDYVTTGTLCITKEKAVFFVSPLDKELYSQIQDVQLIFVEKSVNKALMKFLEEEPSCSRIGFDAQHTPYQRYHERLSPSLVWEPISLFVEKLRSIKSPKERELMRQAAELGSQGYDYVLSLLQLGITEKEVVRLLRAFWANAGAEGLSFSPIVAFGHHAAFPHAVPTDRALSRGDIVLIDIGVLYQGYCSDMTRTVAFGEPDSRLIESYPIVAQAQAVGIQACQAGALCKDVHESAARVLREHGLESYFCHGLGHGVGRNIHEFPSLSPHAGDAVLREGMTVTVEPGVYFPGIGGIRIEDTILIEETKNFSITNRTVSDRLVCL